MTYKSAATSIQNSLQWKHILYTIGVILSVLIILLNLIILMRILTTKRLRTPTNILLINLNLADFLLGQAFLIPSVIHLSIVKSIQINSIEFYSSIYSLLQNNDSGLVIAIYVPIATSMLVSMLTLTAMTIKKYIHILHPFFYMRMVSNLAQTFSVIVFLIWCLAITVCMLPFWLFSYKSSGSCLFSSMSSKCKHSRVLHCMFHRIFRFECFAVFTSICLICSFVIMALYMRIYIVAHRQFNVISERKGRVSDNRNAQTTNMFDKSMFRSGVLEQFDSLINKSNQI
jgi:hypothetical protein